MSFGKYCDLIMRFEKTHGHYSYLFIIFGQRLECFLYKLYAKNTCPVRSAIEMRFTAYIIASVT